MSALLPTQDDRIVWDTWLARYHFPVVSAADEVGTFAALSAEALTTADLAGRLGLDERALGIHLGLLAALGYVERRDSRWRATAAARTWLHPQGEGYYGPMIHRYRDNEPLHKEFVATLRTGDKAKTQPSAAEEWERGEMPAEMALRITAFMNAHSRASSRAAAAQPLFADVRSLMDVGGGSGIFSIELARAWPALRATVMEIGAVCVEADKYIAAAGIGDRVKTQAVDMFRQEWPRGHDAQFFSNIFHDWSDATCRLLANKSFESLAPGGRIVLHEMLMDDDGCGPVAAAAFSMLMLLGTRGRQYSVPELKDFLEGAGFVDVESVKTGGGYYSLVTARKPG
ncbi:MAG: methyltransferase [Steroidobacteraceae bacterium]